MAREQRNEKYLLKKHPHFTCNNNGFSKAFNSIFSIFENMKLSDRALGYISFIVFACIFGGISFGMWAAHQNVRQTAIVDFNELGSLQPEDPVVLRGYRVGTIGSVTWLKDRSRVVIHFTEPLKLREGTQFNNVNYALMGQRRLEIIPSKTGTLMPENHVFQGHFEPGIAETLRLIENVNEQLEAVQKTILLLAQGDSSHKSAPEIYEEAMHSIEDIFAHTEKTVGTLGPKMNKLFKQMNSSSKALTKTALQADTAIKTATATVNEKLSLVDSVVISLTENAKKTNDVITSIENGIDSETLLQSKELVEKINDIIASLNSAVQAIDTKNLGFKDKDGKPIKLITWKNMNIIGDNARDKARKRLEEAKAQQEQKKAGK